MKTLRKITVGLAFIFAIFGCFSISAKNDFSTPLWREQPGSFQMEQIDHLCHLFASDILCSYVYPSTNNRYWANQSKTSPVNGYDDLDIFIYR